MMTPVILFECYGRLVIAGWIGWAIAGSRHGLNTQDYPGWARMTVAAYPHTALVCWWAACCGTAVAMLVSW